MWINKNKNQPKMMLDIGAGNPDESEYSIDNFVKQDVEKYSGIDLVCDIRDLSKFIKQDQCLVVRASHVLEHFSHREIDDIFKTVYKILQPGGIFHIVVPDLEAQANKILHSENQYEKMIEIYGGQKDDLDYHKIGYTVDILKQILNRNGFSIQEITKIEGIGWIDCKAEKL